jgi:hypothetical protein
LRVVVKIIMESLSFFGDVPHNILDVKLSKLWIEKEFHLVWYLHFALGRLGLGESPDVSIMTTAIDQRVIKSYNLNLFQKDLSG